MVTYAFVVISKKVLPNPRSHIFIPVFSSNSFIVLALTFRSIIHFWVAFHLESKCIFFNVDIQLSQHHLWVFVWILSSFNCIGILVENQLTIIGLFLNSQSCSTDLCLALHQHYSVLITVSLRIETSKSKSSSFSHLKLCWLFWVLHISIST